MRSRSPRTAMIPFLLSWRTTIQPRFRSRMLRPAASVVQTPQTSHVCKLGRAAILNQGAMDDGCHIYISTGRPWYPIKGAKQGRLVKMLLRYFQGKKEDRRHHPSCCCPKLALERDGLICLKESLNDAKVLVHGPEVVQTSGAWQAVAEYTRATLRALWIVPGV
ncbi:hypothetical protein BD779DRAFT_784208 [Infundibulicybe gibba]|nr:hypothetical protein BD779DRAFT_784208 [Infundibulicybe gibba]